MKKCPYCAEDIQDAAIVCKHCGRDLAPPVAASTSQPARAPRTSPAIVMFGLGLAAVVVFMIATAINTVINDVDEPTADVPNLQISGGRGVGGLALTNREPTTLDACAVTVLDEGDERWEAAVAEAIAPSATVNVPWASFRNRDQPMPGYIGLNRNISRCHS